MQQTLMRAYCAPSAILTSGCTMAKKNRYRVLTLMEFKEHIRIGQANRKRNIPDRVNSIIKVPVIGRSMTVAIKVNKINKRKVKLTYRKYSERGKRLIDRGLLKSWEKKPVFFAITLG